MIVYRCIAPHASYDLSKGLLGLPSIVEVLWEHI